MCLEEFNVSKFSKKAVMQEVIFPADLSNLMGTSNMGVRCSLLGSNLCVLNKGYAYAGMLQMKIFGKGPGIFW